MNAALRQSLARKVCGSLSVLVAGEACVLRCSGALWLPAHGALVAADLHLEKGSAFAMRGQMLPPYDSRATLDRLEAEIAALDPATVILLGDSFHDTRAIPRMAADDRARLDRLAEGRDWLWLEGNHDREALARDADAAGRLPGRIVGDLSLGGLRLVHEPEALSADDDRRGEVAGHLHPCARVAAYGRGVRRACFVTDGSRLILPAFGAFTGGLNVRDPAIAGLFAAPPMAAALGRDRVHALEWSRLN
ncbi:MAG: ligase-associated DNA damage response endonuclease PdeM [Brevundimonas sp.]|uniref:Ligase-associated DNA damage response endonuclease PdeM n=1 Tax=Brevundimonas albigilva TaxID=1312364 RepID=A0ABY4SJ26_9CAUL|nr:MULTISPECIES: ligase-associated DNA damage response endonuclease PdeM [Brevundimonas]PZU62089.1 MAG: ligase-associated DNA damage response endonuclease PdeM [Brevundimonas sp.]URI14702.1 ligase-associated DNA damage response endonuclease PdeM [Brevundimonas albigilva]